MSLHGDLGPNDKCGTLLNWQNGYSEFSAVTNKLCNATGNLKLNSKPKLSHRISQKQHFLVTTNQFQKLMMTIHTNIDS